MQAAAEADGVSQVGTRDGLEHDLEHTGDLGEAVLGVAEQDGLVVGFHRLGMFEQPDGLEVYTHRGHVLPEARGQGIGSALVTRAERQLIAHAARRATANPKVLSAWFYEGEAGVASLLAASRGYERHRTMLEMQHDLQDIPTHPLPPGLETRSFQPEQLRAIWKAYVAFSADDVSSVIDTEAGFQAWSTLPQWDHRVWVLAWSREDVIGMALSYVDAVVASRGYTEFLGVNRSWRRQGVSRSILALSLRQMQERDVQSVNLDVNSSNRTGARQLYASMGFKVLQQLAVVRRTVSVSGEHCRVRQEGEATSRGLPFR